MHAPALVNQHRHLPSVDAVLHSNGAQELISSFGRDLVVYAVRQTIDRLRRTCGTREKIAAEAVFSQAAELARAMGTASLRPVINATGILLHTNLGRAPLGAWVLKDITPIVKGYSNLEFDLEKAERGQRMTHITRLLACLTGAHDALVVNNNAAAVILALHTFANGREVVVSRGELIEIGGEFRIPEIMTASGARMVEVGTTNRTRISDYEQAINPDTALLFKAHKSNYTIAGFTEEVPVAELASLAHAHHLPLLFDIGSGLLHKPKVAGFANEPDVRSALTDGADLVCFSGDKLLGGPQSGIIAGKRDLLEKLSRAPLMRALRVGKLTIAALSSACRSHLRDEELVKKNQVFNLLKRPVEERRKYADRLWEELHKRSVTAEIIPSIVQCGGGTLPNLKLPGYAVALVAPQEQPKGRESFAERVFHRMLRRDPPVLGVLREGRLLFDTGALFEGDVERIAEAVEECMPEAPGEKKVADRDPT
ncbi:MAG: L-seryl-tRNA(Sec) selenium transferase [Chitinispirillaceae bacterium]|nr:L-seryl-tRNA(Sec) selenium transferase [Chitinispirillaceae bacterium]